MNCPVCESEKTVVLESRPSCGTIRRRRECTCGRRCTTYELRLGTLPEGDLSGLFKELEALIQRVATVCPMLSQIQTEEARSVITMRKSNVG